MTIYDKQFYDTIRSGSYNSAMEIVPIVNELINPKSVIDVGCGTGIWLSVFRRHGIKDIYGVDGDYIDPSCLEINKEDFLAHDLTIPFSIQRTFDLVVSLEVAEHLSIEYSDLFIETLTQLGPAILFSAAIPCQGGLNHLNEQWPEFWIDLFSRKEYRVIDCIRKKVWQNMNVEWWYAQNIFLYVHEDYLRSNYLKFERELCRCETYQYSIVHPRNYLEKAKLANLSLMQKLSMSGLLHAKRLLKKYYISLLFSKKYLR